jgi:hypothetical protein
LVEGFGGAAGVFAGMTAGVETAAPFKWVGVVRVACSARESADMHVPVIDVPAVLAFGITVAGEDGHEPLKRHMPTSASRYPLRVSLSIALDIRKSPRRLRPDLRC